MKHIPLAAIPVPEPKAVLATQVRVVFWGSRVPRVKRKRRQEGGQEGELAKTREKYWERRKR